MTLYTVKLHSSHLILPTQQIEANNTSELDAILVYCYLHSISHTYLRKACKPISGDDIIPYVQNFEDRILARFVEYDLVDTTNVYTCYRDMKTIMSECRSTKDMDPSKTYVYVANPYERRDANLILEVQDIKSFLQKLQQLIDITQDPLIIVS